MKATVQYDDYKGTTAADRCDLFCELPGQMTQNIFDWFKIDLDAEKYLFVGVSVNTTKVEEAYTTLYFRKCESNETVKVVRYSVPLQTVLNLFKRFEFQVGTKIENIDDNKVIEVAKEEA